MAKLHPLAVRNDSSCIKREFVEPKKEFPSVHSLDERSPFQHDKDRILYSKSFRRLMHKTQVCFTGSMNEHIRTRLTHTLEVTQIARAIARQIGVNEDLTEAIALGHDVGHTPFGHVGEYLIHELLTGKDARTVLDTKFKIDAQTLGIGFKHNYQSVRVLMDVEKGYSSYEGLNISYPVLEGILKHSKLSFKDESSFIRYEDITEFSEFHFEQKYSCTIEGQIVSLADEIAQVCHDIEDAIEGNYNSKKIIIGLLNDLLKKDLIKGIEDQTFVKQLENGIEVEIKYFKEFTSWIISLIVLESIEAIRDNMQRYEDIHRQFHTANPDYYPITEDLATEHILDNNDLFKHLKDIQERFIINNYKIHRENGKAKFILRQIIKAYLTNPRQLPDNVLKRYTNVCDIKGVIKILDPLDLHHSTIRYLTEKEFEGFHHNIISDPKFLRILSDYIASMTDFYAFTEYKKLYLEEETGV